MVRGRISSQLQPYIVPTDLQLTKEFNALIENRTIKFQNELEKNKALTELLQNTQAVRNLIDDYYQGKVNLSDEFVKKYSYSYKGNFRPFGRLFPDYISTMKSLGRHERSYQYSELINLENIRERFPARTFIPIGFTKQIGIDEEQEEVIVIPKIQTKTINLYRILFDNLKNEHYITATHHNAVMRESDVQKFENMPQQYVIQNSPSTPYTAIGGRLYESEGGYPPSAIFKSESNVDSLLNTVVSSNDSIVLNDIPFSDSNTGGLDQSIPPSFSLGLSSDVPDVTTNTGVEVNPNVPVGVEYSGVNNEGGNTGGFYGFGSNGGSETSKISDNTVNAGIITGLGSAGIILIGAALLYFSRKRK